MMLGMFFSPDPNGTELLSAGDRVSQPGVFIPFGELSCDKNGVTKVEKKKFCVFTIIVFSILL